MSILSPVQADKLLQELKGDWISTTQNPDTLDFILETTDEHPHGKVRRNGDGFALAMPITASDGRYTLELAGEINLILSIKRENPDRIYVQTFIKNNIGIQYLELKPVTAFNRPG